MENINIKKEPNMADVEMRKLDIKEKNKASFKRGNGCRQDHHHQDHSQGAWFRYVPFVAAGFKRTIVLINSFALP